MSTSRALTVMALAFAGCAAPADPVVDATTARPVFLVDLGRHTRIAVRQADVPADLWPESRALGAGRYVEVGWGDRDYYQADDATVAMALKAVFLPTAAVLHVALLDDLCAARAGLDVVRVDVSPRGLERLARYVSAAYVHDERGLPVRTRAGRDPVSAFFLAVGTYHAFNTSNTWTARALREAGADVTPTLTVFAGGVVRQAHRVGAPACA